MNHGGGGVAEWRSGEEEDWAVEDWWGGLVEEKSEAVVTGKLVTASW